MCLGVHACNNVITVWLFATSDNSAALNQTPFSPHTSPTPQNTALGLFQEAFLTDLRVSHLVQLMGYHPEYLKIFLTTHHLLMHGDGPLAYNVRVYIAILVSCQLSLG